MCEGENMAGLLFWERHCFDVGFEGVQKLRKGFLFGEGGEVIPYRGAKDRKGAEASSIVPNRHVIRCKHGLFERGSVCLHAASADPGVSI